MKFNEIKAAGLKARKDRNKELGARLITLRADIEKQYFDKVKAGEDITDDEVLELVKSQVGAINKAEARGAFSAEMTAQKEFLQSWLPPKITGIDLKHEVQLIFTGNIGKDMGALRARAKEMQYDFDGGEARGIMDELRNA